MKTFKKTLTLAIAFLLILNLFGFSVFAADATEVTVSLIGNAAGAVEGSVYEVTLNIEDLTVGGAQGIITYDTAKFEFKDVTMKRAFAEKNRLAADADNVTTAGEVIKVDETAGTITFALLADGVNADWVTLNFTVKTVAEAVSVSDFTLSGVKVSNASGTAAIATVNLVDATEVSVADAALSIEGSSIRTDGTYDLRFETTLDQNFMALNDVKQVGMILIPTSLIQPGKELLNDPTGASFCVVNNGTQVKPNIGIVDFDPATAVKDANGNYKFYGNILNTGASHMNREYTLRAFVVLNDETVVYCDNENDAKAISNGSASRSCKSTATAIYNAYKANYSYSTEVQEIIAITGKWTEAQYKKVAEENLAALTAQLAN